MKKQLCGVLAVILITALLSLTVYGLGAETSRQYEFKGFTALSVVSGMKLEVTQGEKYEVMIRSNQLELVRVEHSGELLRFYLPPFTVTTASINIFITMPELTKLDLSGGSIAHITMKVTPKNFRASLSGGSRITGTLQAKRLELDLSGGSQTSLTGKADTMVIDASGGSRIQQELFPVKEARLRLSGGCRAEVSVAEVMDIDASGGSQVYYRGNPRLGRTSFSGGAGIQSL